MKRNKASLSKLWLSSHHQVSTSSLTSVTHSWYHKVKNLIKLESNSLRVSSQRQVADCYLTKMRVTCTMNLNTISPSRSRANKNSLVSKARPRLQKIWSLVNSWRHSSWTSSSVVPFPNYGTSSTLCNSWQLYPCLPLTHLETWSRWMRSSVIYRTSRSWRRSNSMTGS